MNSTQFAHTSNLENTVRIVPLSAQEQNRRVEAAIGERAYEIFEKRGGIGGNELNDWHQAEAEIRSTVCFGLTTQNHTAIIGTDSAGFEPGSVEVWVAPRRLTICGKPRATAAQLMTSHFHPAGHMVFREIRLPFAVDFAGARTELHGRFLEIKIPRAVPEKAERAASAA